MKIIPLFAIPTIKTNINRKFTEDELQLLLNIPMEKKGMLHQSAELYLFDSYAEELKELKIYCQYQLKQYLEDVEGADTALANLRITQSWLNRAGPNESHHPHHHPNSWLSGVLYIKCLQNDNIVFSNLMHGFYNSMEFPKRKNTEWNERNSLQYIKEGDLFLFPSWLTHRVAANKKATKDRISISFNTFIRGTLGQQKDLTELILK